MAQVYALEPQTNAKVLLKTNFGDLELELWGRECPLTVRNFLQLCYDGYYNETIFHRLVPGFILQGGDPTGTGHGGEAIYPGGLFADEFHPRIKYNRRGLLGMANGGRKNDNGSQFFLTLGDTKELNQRNTLFGKIVGDTIYNLVRMSELECEEGNPERPLFPPKVTGAEVLVNPFEDIKPREKQASKTDGGKKDAVKGKKKKGGKQLLSFAADDGEEEIVSIKKKPKFDTRLVVDNPEIAAAQAKPKAERRPMRSPTPPLRSPTPPPPEQTKAKSPPRRRRLSHTPTPPPTALEKTNAQIAALKASLRRSASPPPVTAAAAAGKKKSLLDVQKELLPSTSIQGRKRKRVKGESHAEDVDDAYDALTAFRAKLASAATVGPVVAPKEEGTKTMGKKEEGEEELVECDLHFVPGCLSCKSWDVVGAEKEGEGDVKAEELWGHALSFEKDRMGKDLNWKKRNEELVVIDPREKEKEIVGAKRGRGGDRGGRGGGGFKGGDRERGGFGGDRGDRGGFGGDRGRGGGGRWSRGGR